MSDEIVKAILFELKEAEEKRPWWPEDIVYAVAIVNEEAGEAVRAANNHYLEGGTVEEVKKELIQTAAMALRALKNLGI